MINLTANVTFIAVRARVAAGMLFDVPRNVIGGSATESCPPQVAYLIRKSTGVPGRQHRGRMYAPGVRESTVNGGGIIDSSQRAAISANFEALRAGLVAEDLDPVILHSEMAVTPTPITEMSCETRVATQRGRLR